MHHLLQKSIALVRFVCDACNLALARIETPVKLLVLPIAAVTIVVAAALGVVSVTRVAYDPIVMAMVNMVNFAKVPLDGFGNELMRRTHWTIYFLVMIFFSFSLYIYGARVVLTNCSKVKLNNAAWLTATAPIFLLGIYVLFNINGSPESTTTVMARWLSKFYEDSGLQFIDRLTTFGNGLVIIGSPVAFFTGMYSTILVPKPDGSQSSTLSSRMRNAELFQIRQLQQRRLLYLASAVLASGVLEMSALYSWPAAFVIPAKTEAVMTGMMSYDVSVAHLFQALELESRQPNFVEGLAQSHLLGSGFLASVLLLSCYLPSAAILKWIPIDRIDMPENKDHLWLTVGDTTRHIMSVLAIVAPLLIGGQSSIFDLLR